jgi:hypothetical protein
VRAAAALDATQAMRGLETSQDMALSANVDQRADIGSLGRVLLPPGQLARRTTSSSRDQQTPRPPSARADGPAATSRPKVPVRDPNSTRTRVWGPRSRSAPRRGMAAVPEPDGLVGDPLRIESASAMPPMMPGCPAIGKPRAGRRSSGSDSDPVPPSVIGPVESAHLPAQATRRGPCQKFARNSARRSLIPPHDATLHSPSYLRGCAGTCGAARRHERPAHRW